MTRATCSGVMFSLSAYLLPWAICMRLGRPLLFAALLAAGLVAVSISARAGVGLQTLEVREPTTATVMPALVFYPTPAVTGSTKVGPYQVNAEFGKLPRPGRHPLVLLSHGHGGSALGHHPLAVSLAKAGYLVAAVEHAGDSYRDQSGFGTERVLLGRAWQVSSLLDTLLADPRLGHLVDTDRIGVAGFSAGGYTSLLLLGATPDAAHRERYCSVFPQDEELCLQAPVAAPPLTSRRPTVDPRIQAAFVMAPLGVFFDQPSLRAVTRPVFVHSAMADTVLKPKWNALAVRDGVGQLQGWRGVVGAGHYVYLAPCPAAMADSTPALCHDPEGVQREVVQAQVAQEAIAYFDTVLSRSETP